MRLTTKTRYAITAMLDLALRGSEGRLTLANISDSQGISLSYLEQLFAALRAKGLVRGVRGPGGGYQLARDPDQISIADIVCAVDDWVEHTIERTKREFPSRSRCTTRTLWDDLSQQIFDALSSITLHDLVRRGQIREGMLGPYGTEGEMAKKPALAGLPGSTNRTLTF